MLFLLNIPTALIFRECTIAHLVKDFSDRFGYTEIIFGEQFVYKTEDKNRSK